MMLSFHIFFAAKIVTIGYYFLNFAHKINYNQ